MRPSFTCPEVYNEFLSEHFVLQKTDNPFPAIALDQGYEQNNATVKGTGGVVGFHCYGMESALRRREVSGPDGRRLIGEYEDMHGLEGDK